KSKKTCANK
ncbi:Electron transport complex protein RnfC, partial [Haemophilus influenzae]